MEPIISPWLFYFIGMLESFDMMVAIFALCTVIGWATVLMFSMQETPAKFREIHGRNIKLSLFFVVLLMIINTFLPSKETAIQMIVAQNITYDRVTKVADKAGDVHTMLKQDIIDIITEMSNGGQKEKPNESN